MKQIHLTCIKASLPFNASTGIVCKELANKVDKKWGASTLGKRVHVGTKRAGLTYLDRFKLCKAKAAATGWSPSHSVPRRGSW
jgi:hypothetical protein